MLNIKQFNFLDNPLLKWTKKLILSLHHAFHTEACVSETGSGRGPPRPAWFPRCTPSGLPACQPQAVSSSPGREWASSAQSSGLRLPGQSWLVRGQGDSRCGNSCRCADLSVSQSHSVLMSLIPSPPRMPALLPAGGSTDLKGQRQMWSRKLLPE